MCVCCVGDSGTRAGPSPAPFSLSGGDSAHACLLAAHLGASGLEGAECVFLFLILELVRESFTPPSSIFIFFWLGASRAGFPGP